MRRLRSPNSLSLLLLWLCAGVFLTACGPQIITLPPETPAAVLPAPASTDAAPPTAVPTTAAVTAPPAQSEPTPAPPLTGLPELVHPTFAPLGEPVSEFPSPSSYAWKMVISGLNRPVDLQNAGDGSKRLFIIEQDGMILSLDPNTNKLSTFLDISDRVSREGNEQGLLGLAFSPNYARDGLFYVNYTDREGTSTIARFRRSDNPNFTDPQSEQILLTVEQPYRNHNGGGLAFGPDGYLYIALGDGGNAGDPQGNAQNTNTLLGKILRINVATNEGYQIPPDNPFVNGGGKPEIWAYGLRNPWRFSFDRATGDLWIADVGQSALEEINFQPAGAIGGANYGWNYKEGDTPFKGTPPENVTLTDPVFIYNHGKGCSVTGGYVYRGPSLPEFNGLYIFGDYCSGFIWATNRMIGGIKTQDMFKIDGEISAFGQDEAGEIYALDHLTGSLLRLERK